MNAPADFPTYLFTQGILGVVCLALVYALIKLYRDRNASQDERIQDAKDVTKEATTVIQNNTQALAILTAKIDASRSRKEGS